MATEKAITKMMAAAMARFWTYDEKYMAYKLFLMLFLSAFIWVPVCRANDRMTLTLTPPLIRNNLNSGQVWQSYVKVINNNAKEIEVYVQVKDFKPSDESGSIEFLPTEEATSTGRSLSQWVVMEKGPFKIPAFQSKELPFILNVPEDAEPGGHNAAILVGNTPPEDGTGTMIKVSSLIASLLLVDVAGEADERADIREFSTSRHFYNSKNIDFLVRIENKGNVHVLPQGELKIVDFWGKERASMPLNQGTNFGNILPKTTRKWDMEWEASGSLLDMGRYQASLIVSYGRGAVETVERKTYFWIIYLKPLAYLVGGVLFLMALVVLFVRWNVRRAMREIEKHAASAKKNASSDYVGVVKRNPEKISTRARKGSADDSEVLDLRK